jgi:hypothetical protein
MTIRHWFQNYYVGGGEGEANVRAWCYVSPNCIVECGT